jgi:hypothetical protein
VRKYREECAWRFTIARGIGWKPVPVVLNIVYRCAVDQVARAKVMQAPNRIAKTETRRIYLELMAESKRRRKASDLYHPTDKDNAIAALKAAIDALRDAGIVGNDTPEWITMGTFELVRTASDKPNGVTFDVTAK